MRRNDPRIRQTLNQISQNLESANLTTQASLFNFSQSYISPCLSSLGTCLEASCQPCFAAYSNARDGHDRRSAHHRNRPVRGRESLAFDFYDDWERDEAEWGNDELDRLLSGDGEQPGKHGGMSYGIRGTGTGKRKKDEDPNVLPKSSMFGFLESLPWKIGGRGVRYRPSVADLQENVGRRGAEAEPLIGEGNANRGRHGRNRSDTVGSRETANSLSSRGDLFPSEDEDDAVPLDDEFAMALTRRTTGTMSDDRSSGRKGGSKRPGASRTSTKTASSKGGTQSPKEGRAPSISSARKSPLVETPEEEEEDDDDDVPSITDLKQEEERVRDEEEAEVEERRQAAHRLALERGLNNASDAADHPSPTIDQDPKHDTLVQESEVLSPIQTNNPPQPVPSPPDTVTPPPHSSSPPAAPEPKPPDEQSPP